MIEIPDDEQLVFDTVAEHLLKQGKRSICILDDGNEVCAYRGDDLGLKCAAGCLIPDDQYTLHLEGQSWPTLVKENKASSNCAELIDKLQIIHDKCGPEYWFNELYVLARSKNLNISKLQNLQGLK